MRPLTIFLAALVSTFSARAQAPASRVDENSILVKDSIGFTYSPSKWKELILSGNYRLKPVKGGENPSYLLVKLNEVEKVDRLKKMPRPKETENFQTGAPIELFKARDLDGNKIDLRKPSGKITVINFWFVNCMPCRQEIPQLNELAKAYADSNRVQFLAVALDNPARLKQFLQIIPFGYTIIPDGQSIADKYGIHSFPTHLVVDPQGKVYFHTVGLAINTAFWIQKSINELLAQQAQ